MSMVSLATLVLTITMVVVQLAMGQFSPRIVQTFLQDRPSQLAIGLFVATFAHAMLTMREVQFDGDGQVPGVAIVVAYVLVLTSIAMLVLYVHHIGRSLRVSALIELVGTDTRRLLDRQLPGPASCPTNLHPTSSPRPTRGSSSASTRDASSSSPPAPAACCTSSPASAAFVPAGAPLVRDRRLGRRARPGRRYATRCARSLERTLDEDLAYGFRMLVDMAERSLSESPFMDPTTAVQCIDRLHDGLRQLAVRRIDDGRLYAATASSGSRSRRWTGTAYVHLAFDEIRLAGAESPQVSRRLTAALDDLLTVAPPDRHPPLRRQLDLLHEAIAQSSRARSDIDFARRADPEGIGAAARADRTTARSSGGHLPDQPADTPTVRHG